MYYVEHNLTTNKVTSSLESSVQADACNVADGVWNSLPDHLQDPAADTEQFRRDPKMYLFAGHLKRYHIKGVM